MRQRLLALLTFFIISAVSLEAYGSHLRGGWIELEFLQNDEYEIRLFTWFGCSMTPPLNTQTVAYNSPCGSGTIVLPLDTSMIQEVSPVCGAQWSSTLCNGGTLPGLELHVFSSLMTLAPCDAWTFSWNMSTGGGSDVVNVDIYDVALETVLNNLDLPCHSSIWFGQSDLAYLSYNISFGHHLNGIWEGPLDATYELVDVVEPNGSPGQYTIPFSGTVPFPGMTMDAASSQITAGPANMVGNFMINAIGSVVDSTGSLLTSTQRLFHIYSLNVLNQYPEANDGIVQLTSGQAVVTADRSMELWPGQSFCIDAVYSDLDAADTLHLETDFLAKFSGGSVSYSPANPLTVTYCWTAPSNSSGKHNFRSVIRDGACPIEGRQSFLYTVRILPDTLNPCQVVGISDLMSNKSSIKVWPNPSSGELYFEFPMSGSDESIELVGLDGRLVAALQQIDQKVNIPAFVSNGTYMLRCGMFYATLILQR